LIKRRHWTTEDDAVLRHVYPHLSDKDVAQHLQRTLWSIQSRAKRLKLTKSQEHRENFAQERVRQLSKANSKYHVSHNYFSSIDTREKAYWLGWMWSDGNVYRQGESYQIKIDLYKDDAYILQHFAAALNSDYPLYSYKNAVRLLVSSKQMFTDLSRYGIVPRKSGVNYVPNISLDFVSDFIRGVFDGDGCISKGKNAQITIIGTEAFCHWLQVILQSAIGIQGNCALKKNTTFRWVLSGRANISTFAQWIYQPCSNGERPVCLERKSQRFVAAKFL